MKTIEITIDKAGNTKVETKGFEGSSCREASRFVEVALGRRTAEQLKPEFHQGQAVERHVEQSQ